MPTEKTQDDGTVINLEGTMEEFGEVRDRFIDSAIEYDNVQLTDENGNPKSADVEKLTVTDADGNPTTIDPDEEPVLNIFEKAMWVIKASKDLLDEVGIDENHWNEDLDNNSWPVYVVDPAAGMGNAALDELKSIPEMVSLGLSMFDKEVRQQLWESITSVSWSTLKDMIGDKADEYAETPVYAGSYDATTVIIAILTGGKKVLDDLTTILKKSGKLGDINWSRIREFGFNDDQAKRLADNIAESDELAEALTENADLADGWKKMDDIDPNNPLGKDPDFLKKVNDWDGAGATLSKNVDGNLDLADAAGDRIAEIKNGEVLPDKYDFDPSTGSSSPNGTPIGEPQSGYQLVDDGGHLKMKRKPDLSEYDADDLSKLKANSQAHTLERDGADVTEASLHKRATTGIAPDGSSVTRVNNGVDEVNIPTKSSKFNSAGDVKKALDEVGPGTTKYNAAKQQAIADGRPTFVVEHDFGAGNSIGSAYEVPGGSGWQPKSSLPLSGTPVKLVVFIQ